MWTAEHSLPMLPWSHIILESTPEAAVNEMLRTSPAAVSAWSSNRGAAAAKQDA